MKVEDINVDEAIGAIGEVLTRGQKKRGLLIYAFQQIQKEHNYLPGDELNKLSKKLEIPLVDVYSTASFYKHFYFTPRGRNIACVCMGTACYVRGGEKILDELSEEFGIKEGETTEDMSLTIETVGCVGCCGLAPVIVVNEEISGEMTPKKLTKLVEGIRSR